MTPLQTTAAPAHDWRPAALRLSAMFAAIHFHNGVQLPFFPLWLSARGLSGDAIAFVLALPLFMRILSGPVVGAIADRRGDAAGVLAACSLATLGAYACLFFADGFFAIAFVIALIACVQGPMNTLADALTVTEVRAAQAATPARAPTYGRIRMWGSIAFVAGNLGGGFVTGWLGVASVIYMLAGAVVLAALVACEARASLPAQAVLSGTGEAVDFAHRPRLVLAIIAAAALIQASHALAYSFAALHWNAKGLPDIFLGFGWTIGVCAEIALFFVSGQLISNERRAVLFLAAGGLFAVLRWTLMAGDPDPALLLALQFIHGITFGATHLGSIALVAALTPPQMRARAQSWLSAAISLTMAIAIMASGPLYGRLGEGAYFVMAAVAACGLAIGLAAEWGRRRVV